jgi:hypothetical protein
MLAKINNSEYSASERKLLLMSNTRVVDHAKLAWLTAMIEAEGTFTFQYNEQEKDGTIHSHIQPLVIFTNSDLLLVNRVAEIMTGFGFPPYWRKPRISGIGKKQKTEVQYNGFKALPLLKLLRPHMVGEKTECVDCMIKFIEFRQALQAAHKPKVKYGDVEFGLLRRVRAINSGHWKQVPKFSQISTEAVKQRREDHAKTKLAIVS